MSRAAALLQLQQLDLELDADRARLAAIEAELGDNAAVRAVQRESVEAQAQLHSARVALQQLEYDSQDLNVKIADIDKRLFDGAVTHPKQLQDLQKDLESLRRRRAALEEKQFEALMAAEAAEVRCNALQTALEQAEADAARAHGGLLDERSKVQASVARLETAREALTGSIPPADRELYDRMRPGKRGRPVSRLEDGMCAACGVAPSSSRSQSVRQGNELILCGNCGRILSSD